MSQTSYLMDGDKKQWTLPNAAQAVKTGSVMTWITRKAVRGEDADDWAIFNAYVDADNYIAMFGNKNANTVTARYRVGGTNYDVTFTPDAWTVNSWIDVGCSWSAPNGYLRAYWEGAEVGTAILLPTAISTASATLYQNWIDSTKPLFGLMDQFLFYQVQMPAADFARYTTARF